LFQTSHPRCQTFKDDDFREFLGGLAVRTQHFIAVAGFKPWLRNREEIDGFAKHVSAIGISSWVIRE